MVFGIGLLLAPAQAGGNHGKEARRLLAFVLEVVGQVGVEGDTVALIQLVAGTGDHPHPRPPAGDPGLAASRPAPPRGGPPPPPPAPPPRGAGGSGAPPPPRGWAGNRRRAAPAGGGPPPRSHGRRVRACAARPHD